MTSSRATIALFTLILLEGYVVLSSELLAIRLSLPFVGSGTDTISIIIAAVLMPLAFGYQAGGRFKPGFQRTLFGDYRYISVREKLVTNMLIALGILLPGLSYSLLDGLFMTLLEFGFSNRFILTALYAGLFIVTPVYLLAQTIPLTCNYFSKQRLAKITARILFFSTLGSFLGAVFSTLVLMAHIGVHNTAIINFVILGILITVMSREKLSMRIALTWAIVLAGILGNSAQVMKDLRIVENNQYNTISVMRTDGQRHLFINKNSSSMYSETGQKHAYIEFIERILLNTIPENQGPKDILVLGAGAFTLGSEDEVNNYDIVDIDKNLKGIAEKHILQKSIGKNKDFHAMPARAYLAQTQKQYDVVIFDVYTGGLTLPEHLVTKEFFEQIRNRLKPNGSFIANMALSPNFATPISRNFDNTIRVIFPHISRHVIGEAYGLWTENEDEIRNVMYVYKSHPKDDKKSIYTDTKNSSFLDRPANRP